THSRALSIGEFPDRLRRAQRSGARRGRDLKHRSKDKRPNSLRLFVNLNQGNIRGANTNKSPSLRRNHNHRPRLNSQIEGRKARDVPKILNYCFEQTLV
ncbi:MAG: hypothetical protein ACRD8U_19085, partial [Pyrinomonadaceae bacterium]